MEVLGVTYDRTGVTLQGAGPLLLGVRSWGGAANKHLALLDKVQDRAARLIRNSELGLQPALHTLQHRRDVAGLTVMFKVQQQRVPYLQALRQPARHAEVTSRVVIRAPGELLQPSATQLILSFTKEHKGGTSSTFLGLGMAVSIKLLCDGYYISLPPHVWYLAHGTSGVPRGRYIEGSGRHCRALVDAGVAGDPSQPYLTSPYLTYRVSLTYRVTSAHKIKLTDKQLLQWLTPILLIMLVYLSAWSLSATPSAEVKAADSGLKYKQCKYDWWDHSLAAGEVLFLMWGMKVCFSVRKADSFFDEAKYISWAVYNIALVNIVMVAFHLIIFPDAGPDVKYLFGFLRTQFSTSTTVLLIFGPKFYRIVQGTGDQYDNRARAKGVTASFSLNGLGVMNDEPADLSQENEELKEEIQKLAAQMEFMKIVHMEMNNRHLKPKPSGYFSDKNPAMAGPTSPSGPRTTDAGQENAPAKLSSPATEVADDRV
ncbi:LOW QUALITY PROTEIN: probable G-protein coupled receptor CG31760 [Scylla paramamosain]|uniref:LOW QUALITY PROTEIN: probable G-protein coupled receptor CG31760 n=1 Tax=Scylla paramamosain TaxID=85552 RepID=UPI0030838C85